MTEVKSHEFDGFLARAAKSASLFVLFGPDRGLVSERATLIAKATGIPLDDPFALTRLEASELASDPGRFLDEANSIGLFGGRKLIWIRNAGNEKALVEGLTVLADNPPEQAVVIIEAGDLKKGTGLRKAAEAARSVSAIVCYGDDDRSLNTLIDKELQAANLGISLAARTRLKEALGGDRLASRTEIQKLALYCKGNASIEEQDVIDIIGDASAISLDDAVDAVLSGKTDEFIHAINKIITSKTAVFLVLQATLRQFQLMDLMRTEMDAKKLPATQVMATMGRHIHFKRKPILEQALQKWSGEAISREMNRLQAAILQTRQRATLENTIATQTLLSTALQSARSAGR